MLLLVPFITRSVIFGSFSGLFIQDALEIRGGGGIWSLTSFSGILPGFLGFFGFLLLSFEITRIFKWLGVVFEASIDNFYLWLASNSRWRCHGVGEGFLQLHAVVLENPI